MGISAAPPPASAAPAAQSTQGPAAAAASSSAANPGGLPPRFRDAIATLTDSAAPEAARLEAARVLASTEAPLPTVAALLDSTDPDDQAPRLLLSALAESFNPAWRPTLLAGARPESGWPEARRARAIGALALDHSRETVRGLIDRLAPAEAPAVRAAATSALIRITGRDDDEARRRGSREAWVNWLSRKDHLPEGLWLAELASGCSARSERLAAARRDVETQYRAAMEKLYNASDPEERQSMLLGMLQEPLAAIRQLGLDLVERALDGSQRVGPPVAGQIITLLTDPSPDIRGRAALLLDRMRPEGAGAPVAEALLREKDPEVAGRLLLALRNWPTPVTRDVTLRWLAFDDPVIRRRAARAILAAVDAGVLSRPEDHRTIVETLRRPAPESLSREGMELLARFGDGGDREVLATLLDGADASARRLAGAALASRPEFRHRLLEAAGRDPQLLPVLAEGLSAGNPPPTLDEYRAVAALAGAQPGAEEHLAAIAGALRLADLIEVAHRDVLARAQRQATAPAEPDPPAPPDAPLEAPFPSPQFTERILARCLDTARGINGGAAPPEAPDLAEGLLLLARVRLSLERPDTALAALEAAHPEWNPELAPEIADTRTLALLLLGRLDDQRLTDSADTWLEALDSCIRRQLPHARRVHDAAARLAPGFSEQQRARFTSLALLLPPEPPAAEPITASEPAPGGGGG